jgi:hypothetical protein
MYIRMCVCVCVRAFLYSFALLYHVTYYQFTNRYETKREGIAPSPPPLLFHSFVLEHNDTLF